MAAVERSNGGGEDSAQIASSSSKSPSVKTKKSKNALDCKITTLEGETLHIEVDKHAHAEILYSKVIHQLNITEKEYFGLRFTDPETNADRWLDLQKSMKKQISGSSPEFCFCVKFYEPEPTRITDEHTRYLLYQQLRSDIITGRLVCPQKTYIILGSYTVQAEVGDHDLSDHGNNYLAEYQFSPKEDSHLVPKISSLHREHRGQSPAQAELNFLEVAKRIDRYGISIHEAKDKDDEAVLICVSHAGIHIEKDDKTTHSFLWPQIDNVVHKRKSFKLRLQKPANKEKIERHFAYDLDSKRASKKLYKSCVEFHTFFRLTEADPPRKKTEFFKLKSKFRYSDRTLYQLRSRSSLSPSSPTSFSRSPSKRRTIASPPKSNDLPVKPLRAPIAAQAKEEFDTETVQPKEDQTEAAPEEVEINEEDPQDDKYSKEEWEVVSKTMPDGTTKRFRRRIVTTTTVTTTTLVTTSFATPGASPHEEDEVLMETKPIQASIPKEDSQQRVAHSPGVTVHAKDSDEGKPGDILGNTLEQDIMGVLDMEITKEEEPQVAEGKGPGECYEEASIEEIKAASVLHSAPCVDLKHEKAPLEDATTDNVGTTTTTVTTIITRVKSGAEEETPDDSTDSAAIIVRHHHEEPKPTAPHPPTPEADSVESIEAFVQSALNLPPDVEDGLNTRKDADAIGEVEPVVITTHIQCEQQTPECEDFTLRHHVPAVASGIPRSKTLERQKKPIVDPPRRHSGSHSKQAPSTLPRSSKNKPRPGSPDDPSQCESLLRTKAEAEIKYSLKDDLALDHEQGERGFVKDQVVQNETIVKGMEDQPADVLNRPRSRVFSSPDQVPQFKSAIPTRTTTFSRVQTSTVTSVKDPPPIRTKPVVIEPVSSGAAVFRIQEQRDHAPVNGATDPATPTESVHQHAHPVPHIETNTVLFDPSAPPFTTQRSDEGYVEEVIDGKVVRRRIKTVKTVTKTIQQAPRREPLKGHTGGEDHPDGDNDDFSLDDWVQSNFKPVDDEISVEEKRMSRDFLAQSPPIETVLEKQTRVPPPVAPRDPGSRNSTPEMIDLDEISGDGMHVTSHHSSPEHNMTPLKVASVSTEVQEEETCAKEMSVPVESSLDSRLHDDASTGSEKDPDDYDVIRASEGVPGQSCPPTVTLIDPQQDEPNRNTPGRTEIITTQTVVSPGPQHNHAPAMDAAPNCHGDQPSSEDVVAVHSGDPGCEQVVITKHTTLPTEYVTKTIVIEADESSLTPEQRAMLQGQSEAVLVGTTTTTTQIVKTTRVQTVVSGDSETVTIVTDGESDESLQQAIAEALEKAGVDVPHQLSMTTTTTRTQDGGKETQCD